MYQELAQKVREEAVRDTLVFLAKEELAARHPSGAVRELLLRLAREELAHKEKMEYL